MILSFLACAPASLTLVPEAEAVTPLTPAKVGQPAPDFTLNGVDGAPVKLSSLRGKTVVIEWFNPGCPFVKYAHGEGPLKDQAARTTAKGVAWLAVNSSAPGKEGNGLDLNREAAKSWGMAHPVLLDEDGRVGRLYGATTTPNMFVVDPAGTLVYAGALDNAPLGKVADGQAATNYVDAALGDLAAGRPVATATTKPYGCGVKYGG